MIPLSSTNNDSASLNHSSSFSIDPADLDGSTSPVQRYMYNSNSSRMMSQEDEASGLNNGYHPVGNGNGTNAHASQQPQPESMYGSFTGYAFTVNYILGVGVLGMPYAFYRGGYILSAMCLGLVTIMATYTALWLVDVSLRAQYMKRANHLLRGTSLSNTPTPTGIPYSSDVHEIGPAVSTNLHHRFEMNELCEMFLGLKARRFYEVLIIIYLVGALWSYSSVFSSSLASHIGLPGINGGEECDIYKDHSSACSDLYYTYMGMFALVAIPLTCLDLTEMKLLQIALAIFRFVALATMMITSVVAIYSYPNPDSDAHSSPTKPYTSEGITAFNWSNLGLVFPVAVYSQIFHHSVPGLSHPLKNKKDAPKVFTGVLITTMTLYTLLGVCVSFYYGGSVPQTCTLAWATYTGGHDAPGETKPGWANFISYLVVLFPPIDIISAFPLNAITLGNNLLCAFVEDERKQQLRRYKLPFRLLAAVPPIIGAMIVKDLGVILQYTGCVGVLIAFVYPAVLQWQSKRTCMKLAIMVEDEDASPAALDQQDDEDDRKHVPVHTPTYNGKIINHPSAFYIVLAFSAIGLIAVIVLSFV